VIRIKPDKWGGCLLLLSIAAAVLLSGCREGEETNTSGGAGTPPIMSEESEESEESEGSEGSEESEESEGSEESEESEESEDSGSSSSTTTYSGTVVGELTINPYNIVLNDDFPIRFDISSNDQVTVYVDDLSPVTVPLQGSGFSYTVTRSFTGLGAATCSSTVSGSGTLSSDQIVGSLSGSPTCSDGLSGTVSGSYTASRS
tara:strand:+ start:1153 stop:1758 length:606 start_codon:yes stop_codon:yes gene_type:complete